MVGAVGGYDRRRVGAELHRQRELPTAPSEGPAHILHMERLRADRSRLMGTIHVANVDATLGTLVVPEAVTTLFIEVGGSESNATLTPPRPTDSASRATSGSTGGGLFVVRPRRASFFVRRRCRLSFQRSRRGGAPPWF